MSKNILIVDDSASMRQMVAFTLKDAGYEVVEATELAGLSRRVLRLTPIGNIKG